MTSSLRSFQQLSHSLRVTARFDVGELSTLTSATGADVCLPAATTLSDALPELQDLAEAPIISVPWQARTAAGQVLDLHQPVGVTGLSHGDVIYFTPMEEELPAIRKDAAEALSDLGSKFDARGLSAVAASIGVLALVLLASRASLPTVPSYVLLLLLTTTTIAVTTWLRIAAPHEVLARHMLALASAVLAGSCLWIIIAGTRIPDRVDQQGWLLLASLGGAAVAFAFLAWAADLSPLSSAAAGSSAALIAVWGGSLLWVTAVPAGASVALFFSFILLLFAPGLSTMLAGLYVPALPAAGQDLKISDHSIDNPDEKARRAAHILDGLSVGTGMVAACALLVTGLFSSQTGFATALCLASALASVLHAARHRSPIAMWGLWIWSSAGLLAGAIAGLTAGAGGVFATLLAGLCALSAPLWAGKIRSLSPTALNWLERCEALALAASFPLAARLAGLFDAIRGLG